MNFVDKYYEIFRPAVAVRRQRSRLELDILREYEAAKPRRNSKSYARKNKKASDEAGKAHRPLAGGAQYLVRNNALAHRIKSVIASNIIGAGIKPDYSGNATRRLTHYKNTFEQWANSTACDYEGHNNFYGLQYLWAATVVESGGVLIRRIVNNHAYNSPLVLQTLEQQYLDDGKTPTRENSTVINGIEYRDNKIHGYWLKTSLAGNDWRSDSKFFPAEDIIHIYRKDRPGQHLGVSWFHSVADLIDMRQEWRDAVIMQQRIAACYGVVVTNSDNELGLDKNDARLLDGDGNEYSEIEPGMVAYLNAGAEVKTITPPNLSHTTDFNSGVIQDIAAGVGITREQLSGDFSQVTWASGRLARGEFYTNLDNWQQFIMIPALNKVHDWFDQLFQVVHGASGAEHRTWVLPHRSAVNPKEELQVDIMKVRTAAMTPQQFCIKHGIKFEQAIKDWQAAKTIMGDLPFDFDPSKFSNAGNQLTETGNANKSADEDETPDDKKENKDGSETDDTEK